MGAQTLAVPLRRVVWPRSELALPALLAVLAQADVWAPASYNLGHLVGPAPVVAFLYVVTSMALVWRKRLSLAVLAFIVTVDAVEYMTFGAPEGLGSLLPTVVAFYAVGRYARMGALTAAAPLALLGIAVHELTDPVFRLTGSNAVFYGVVAAAWPIGLAFRRRAEHADRLQARADQLAQQQALARREAASEERARIARELHDVVGHGLSVTVLQLVGANALLDKERVPDARSHLANTERTARQTLAEMRRLLGLLQADDADVALAPQPGLAQLAELVENARLAGADVTVDVTGDLEGLPPGLGLTAYRVLQESLTNVLKHAQPAVCAVRVTRTPEQLTLDIRDDGTTAAAAPPGRGLTGMRERVAVFGGSFDAGVLPSGGFAVRAEFPAADR